jgi:DNA polymerase III subunit gamma/tau
MLDAYRSLALKWRPSTFLDVVNQQVAVTILRNSLKVNKIFPSLVFYGASGSGKTSLARIHAKALNCEDFNLDVCGKCASCKSFSDDGSLCYLEIDAASNGGVEDVHKLIKKLQYEVPGVKYRVVTLDECHMLSTAAWNAMLKVIEEPPPHVIFIFVTTEIRKVPEPVLGRCFPIPFKRIASSEIEKRLLDIAKAEGINIAPDIIHAVAERSEGKLRDAVTLLEQLWILSDNGKVSEEALSLIGVCGHDVYAKLVDLILTGRLGEGVALFRSWVDSMGPQDFLKGLEDYLHKVFLYQNGIPVNVLLPETKVTWEELIECIGKVWGIQDVVRSKYSQARVEQMMARMLVRFRNAGQDGPVEKNPPPLQDTAGQRSSFLDAKEIKNLGDFQKLWQ